jgi:hypothetical protein
VGPAIKKALEVVKKGKPAVIQDFRVLIEYT